FDSANQNSWMDDLLPYLRSDKLKIVRLGLQFRSNNITLPETNADGYSFHFGHAGIMGGNSKGLYCLGVLSGNTVKLRKYFVPELIFHDEENVEKNKVKTLYENKLAT